MNEIRKRKCIVCLKEFKYNSHGARHNKSKVPKRGKSNVTCSPTCSKLYTRIYSRIQTNMNKERYSEEI